MSAYLKKLGFEVIVFSLALAVVGTPISIGFMWLYGNKSIPLALVFKVFFTFTIIATVFHVLCELLGVNKWYIRNGAARLKITQPV